MDDTSRDFVGYEALIDFLAKRGIYNLQGDIIEIGVFMGGGTAKLARTAAWHGKKIFAVDVFDVQFDSSPGADGTKMCDIYGAFLNGKSQEEVYRDTIRDLENVVTIAGDSREVTFPAEQVFVFGFIDGNHQPEYVESDFYLVWKHLAPGGVVGFHDYDFELPRVTAAIDGLIERHQSEIQAIDRIRDRQIILLTKTGSGLRQPQALERIQVETTNHCNAKCIFCAHSRIPERGTMSGRLYSKILSDLSRLTPPLKTFIPMLIGEPLLDPHILDRIREARAVLPHSEIELYTNGSLLTEQIINNLAPVQGFRLNISANGAARETRKRLTGLDDFEHLDRMIGQVDRAGIPHSVSMVQHPSITADEEEAFNLKWGAASSASSNRIPYVFQHLNFAGLTRASEGINFTRCIHATSYMTVFWNGIVNLCCMDPLGRKTFGDLNHRSVAEIWYSEERQRYCQIHNEGNGARLELCRDCNMASF